MLKNPAGRAGLAALKDELAWECFPDLPALQARVVALVQDWDVAVVARLSLDPGRGSCASSIAKRYYVRCGLSEISAILDQFSINCSTIGAKCPLYRS